MKKTICAMFLLFLLSGVLAEEAPSPLPPMPLSESAAASLSALQTLTPGCDSKAVLAAREQLWRLGYFSGKPTQTLFTGGMSDFVRRFEKDWGLPEDGILSPLDQAVLFSAEGEERLTAPAASGYVSKDSVSNDEIMRSTVTLSWQSVPGAAGYNIYRSGEEETPVFIGSTEELSFTDLTAPSGVCVYRVQAASGTPGVRAALSEAVKVSVPEVFRKVTALTDDRSELFLPVGGSVKLSPRVLPDDATEIRLTYSSSDEKTASVNKNGDVTAKKTGAAVITVTETVSGVHLEYALTVYQPVTGIRFDDDRLKGQKLTLLAGRKEEAIRCELRPAGATYTGLLWSSSDPSVLSVDETTGTLTPRGAGSAAVTVRSAQPDENGAVSAQFTVKVLQPVEQITFEETEPVVEKGKKRRLSVTVLPKNASDKTVVWSSSDKSIATVDENGRLAAVGSGEVTVTVCAKDGSGVSASLTLLIHQAVTGVKFPEESYTLTEGNTLKLTAAVSPADATDRGLIWSSSDPDIAKVDKNGKVSAVSAGLCTITAVSTDDRAKKASVKLAVDPAVPLRCTDMKRNEYFGYYTEFALTFKNRNASRTVYGIRFTLTCDAQGQERSFTFASSGDTKLGAGNEKQLGCWDCGFLTYGTDFRVYLNSVTYKNGVVETFPEGTLIGRFE